MVLITSSDNYNLEHLKKYNNFIITNGYFFANDFSEYKINNDGTVQIGLPEKKDIIVCVIGKNTFTVKQLLETLPDLCYRICKKYNLNPVADIEVDTNTNIDVDRIIEIILNRYY